MRPISGWWPLVLSLSLALGACSQPAPPQTGAHAHGPGHGPGDVTVGHELTQEEAAALAIDPTYDGGELHLKLAASANSQELRRHVPYFDSNPADNIVEINILAERAQLQLVPGAPTELVVFRDANFNGTGRPGPAGFPGPAIICREGDQVIVHVRNNLPSDFPLFPAFPDETSVHFHGMIIEPEQDGSPQSKVAPGDIHTYIWTAAIGFPMPGWYHAHPHGTTRVQVGRGMAGALLVLPRAGLSKPNPEDYPPEEQVTKPDPIPAAFGDEILFLTDFRFDANNQLGPDNEFDRINGREGNVLTVNGQLFPTLTLRPGEVRRLRFYDTSQARFYKLNIRPPAGGVKMKFVQIGTDGGLHLLPEVKDNILISTAERFEVLIKAPDQPGDHVLESLPFNRGQGLRERVPLPLMRIHVEGAPISQPPIPGRLRFVPNLFQRFGNQAIERFLRISLRSVSNGHEHFTIDRKIFDPLRIDNIVRFGTTEIWNINNKQGNWAHPMHLHNIQFQVIDIDGKLEPQNNPKWKDTVNVPRSARARMIERFNDRRGLFFFHCHILQHEDDGLMTTAYIEENGVVYDTPDEEPIGNLGRPPEVIEPEDADEEDD